MNGCSSWTVQLKAKRQSKKVLKLNYLSTAIVKIYYKITTFFTALKIAEHFENPDYIVIYMFAGKNKGF